MKKFKNQEIRDLLNQVYHEEISFSRMVEILNERVMEAEKKCVEDIPKRKFQKGDKVRIKEGISNKTHKRKCPFFTQEMDGLIGKTMTVDSYTDWDNCIKCEGIYWSFLEEWLEPYTDELKKGDLAIFWDEAKKYAIIRIYDQSNESEGYLQHTDNIGFHWDNATKYESVEQYERFINGEI